MVTFDYDKLSVNEKKLYDKLSDAQRETFEKKWLDVEKQKEKTRQAKAQLAKMAAAQRKKEQKERNHRLIVIGGIIEKYCGEIVNQAAFEEYISKYSYAIKKINVPIEDKEESAPSGDDTHASDYFSSSYWWRFFSVQKRNEDMSECSKRFVKSQERKFAAKEKEILYPYRVKVSFLYRVITVFRNQ